MMHCFKAALHKTKREKLSVMCTNREDPPNTSNVNGSCRTLCRGKSTISNLPVSKPTRQQSQPRRPVLL